MTTNANSLIGKTISVGGRSVTVRNMIGEGGYAWVYRADDASGTPYALKWVNCLTPERFAQFKQEAAILKSLPEHPNIVKLYASDENEKTLVVTLLYEFCPATAMSILQKREMTKEEILIFFTACAEATAFLHEQKPPIIHRDLKPENLLVAMDGTPRLCDFGSCTRTIYQIKTTAEIGAAGEDIERNTTQNYRAPEMIDLYKRVEIGPAADVWALGCTLFKLIYRDDMYKQDERLPILQGKSRVPPDCDEGFAMIISQCIQVDPAKRPKAAEIAGTAKMMRGPKTKIEIKVEEEKAPAAAAPPRAGQQPKPAAEKKKEGSGWKWSNPIKFVQEQYRSWAASGAAQWAIKATFASGDPPNSKYVRRVLLASVRHTETSSTQIVDYLLNERPWQDDSRVAAKSLYLILLLVQYETSLDPFVPITVKTDQVIAHFATEKAASTRHIVEALNQLGNVLRTKIMLHATHKYLQGNLAIGDAQPNDGLEADLARYLGTIQKSADVLLKTAVTAKDFCVAVLAQPAVDEVCNAVKILSFIKKDPASDAALEAARKVIDAARKMTFLKTAVTFPDENGEPPFPRFAVKQ